LKIYLAGNISSKEMEDGLFEADAHRLLTYWYHRPNAKGEKVFHYRTKRMLPDEQEKESTWEDVKATIAHRPVIQKCEKQLRLNLCNLKRSIYEIGRLLCMVKNQFIVHGQFKIWLQHQFSQDISYPSCANYMRIYKTFQHYPELVEKVPMTYLLDIIRNGYADEIKELFDREGLEEARKAIAEKRLKKVTGLTSDPSDAVEKIIENYSNASDAAYFEWLMINIDSTVKSVGKIKMCNTLAESFNRLPSAPYLPEKILEKLKQIEDTGLFKNFQKVRTIIDEIENSFFEVKSYFKEKVENGEQER
jgi:hypothetical protein